MTTNQIDISQVFSEGGLFARFLPKYETRPGQVALAEHIHSALTEGTHLLAEGPTGVGKSFACLVPPILLEQRVLVATANITLQNQLIRKDLPFLKRLFPDITFAILKGRGNYLCWTGLLDPATEKLAIQVDGESGSQEFARLRQWAYQTETGDRDEYGLSPIWWRVSRSETCLGTKCPNRNICFTERAFRRAKHSQVVVTNYHRLLSGGRLPMHQVLICDEAHEIPDIARSLLGFTITDRTARSVASRVLKSTVPDEQRLRGAIQAASDDIFPDQLNRILEVESRNPKSTCTLSASMLKLEQLLSLLEKLELIAASKTAEATAVDKQKSAEAEVSEKLVDALIGRLRLIQACDQPDWAFWVARSHDRNKLEGRPIEVAHLLAEKFFQSSRSCVFVSATLTTGGSFNFIREELGAEGQNIHTFKAESPFDYSRNRLIVLPDNVPTPPRGSAWQSDATKLWRAAIADCVEELIYACDGRTLALFTSNASMRFTQEELVRREVAQRLGLTIYTQHEEPTPDLIRKFAGDERSVLLGVASFWTGVDVPGKALTGLFIDKIPFVVPTDPLVSAIQRSLRKRGKDPFSAYVVPRAVLRLNQGIGRLIRTKEDRGVVVLADDRVLQSYMHPFRRDLVCARHSDGTIPRSLDSVAVFLTDGSLPEERDLLAEL